MASLSSIPPLGETNYATWKARAEGALIRLKLQSAIKPPVVGDPNDIGAAADAAAAASIDEEAKAVLLSLMDDTRLQQNQHFKTSYEMWIDLATSYERSLPAKRNAINRELSNIRLGNMTVTVYMDNIKGLQATLTAMGCPKSEEELVRIALDGLRDKPEYDMAVSFIEEQSSTPTIGEVQSRLATTEQRINERNRQGRNNERHEGRAYLAGSAGRKTNEGESRPRGNQQQSGGRSNGCYVCGGAHRAHECPRRFGQPGYVQPANENHRSEPKYLEF
jgi:hypothetical protein